MKFQNHKRDSFKSFKKIKQFKKQQKRKLKSIKKQNLLINEKSWRCDAVQPYRMDRVHSDVIAQEKSCQKNKYVTGIKCLKRLDSHTMAGITMALSSIIQLKEVPHAENRRIFKAVQSQRQNAPSLWWDWPFETGWNRPLHGLPVLQRGSAPNSGTHRRAEGYGLLPCGYRQNPWSL